MPQQGSWQQQLQPVDLPVGQGYGSGFTGFLTSPEVSQGLIGAGSAILNSGYGGNIGAAMGGFNEGFQNTHQKRIENAQKNLTANSMLGGGSTGILIKQYMDATGADFPTALNAVKSNLANQGLQYQDGGVAPIPGYIGTTAKIAGAKAGAQQNAQNASDLNYGGAIKAVEAAGSEIGKKQGTQQAKAITASGVIDLVNQAEEILPKATSGTLQNIGTKATNFIGKSTDASEADAKLDQIAAGLTLNIPRMEGPQSDRDTALYKEAAGNVANRNLPYKTRLAAVQQVKALNQKYLQQSIPFKNNPQNLSQPTSLQSKSGHRFTVIRN